MKSELLKEQFSSVFTREDNSEPPQMENSPYQEIPSIDFNVAGIAKLLSELDPTKSSGPDRIPSKLLKTLATEVSPCLKLLFTASLRQSSLPSDWKKALVCPLF